MKNGIIGLGLTLTAAILAAPAGAVPHADSSALGTGKSAASLGSATRRSISEFVDAYANRNSTGLARTTTADFEVRFRLAQPGTYVTVDEDALAASWRDPGLNSSDEHSKVAIFPTGDAHVVFVTYRIPGDAGSERIALLELRGDRVARAHDLIAPAPEFIEHAGWTNSGRTVGGLAIAATVSAADVQSQAQEVLIGPRAMSVAASEATPAISRSTNRPGVDAQQQAADVLRGLSREISKSLPTRLAQGASRTPQSAHPWRFSSSQEMAQKVVLGTVGE